MRDRAAGQAAGGLGQHSPKRAALAGTRILISRGDGYPSADAPRTSLDAIAHPLRPPRPAAAVGPAFVVRTPGRASAAAGVPYWRPRRASIVRILGAAFLFLLLVMVAISESWIAWRGS